MRKGPLDQWSLLPAPIAHANAAELAAMALLSAAECKAGVCRDLRKDQPNNCASCSGARG